MSDCVFCRILAGEIPAQIVFQDEQVVAFRDINPAAPTHILVIPRRHIPDMLAPGAGEPEIWGALIGAMQKMAVAEGVSADGFRIVINTGTRAGQTVPHLHLHLLGGKDFTSL